MDNTEPSTGLSVGPAADPEYRVDTYGMPVDQDFWLVFLPDLDQEISRSGWGQPARVIGLTRDADAAAFSPPKLIAHPVDLPSDSIESLQDVVLPDNYPAVVGVWEQALPVPGSDEPARCRTLCAVTRSGHVFAVLHHSDPGAALERLESVDLHAEPLTQVLRRAIGAAGS